MKVQIQTDKGYGCIPTCAIGVLNHLGIPAPSEPDLVVELWCKQRSGSGFERLALALAGKASVAIEKKLRGSNMIDRLHELTQVAIPVLVAVNKPAVHCLVVTKIDSNTKNVTYLDPADGQEHQEPAERFVGRTADDIAVLSANSLSFAEVDRQIQIEPRWDGLQKCTFALKALDVATAVATLTTCWDQASKFRDYAARAGNANEKAKSIATNFNGDPVFVVGYPRHVLNKLWADKYPEANDDTVILDGNHRLTALGLRHAEGKNDDIRVGLYLGA